MTIVAAVVVTRNSAVHLKETLDSIRGQSRSPDFSIAIDDRSIDNTVDQLHAAGFDVHISTSSDTDSSTRIAQNFVHGVRVAQQQGADVVILGDHDDVWHPGRIEHQSGILDADPSIVMVASDGFLIDENGVALPGTIRSTFPVPEDFTQWTMRQQMRYALRHSIATGGASALRPARLAQWVVPPGWLHDRWWSLASLRKQAFIADPTPVIDYRITPDQQVGLDTAGQDNSRTWWMSRARNLGHSAERAKDIAKLLRS